jgi:hypothetical protein
MGFEQAAAGLDPGVPGVFGASRRPIARVALPQAPTSLPSGLKMRIFTSARSDGSSTINWSQPMPVFRSASALARAADIASGSTRASITTKSLPRPCILRKGMRIGAI